MKKKFLKLLKWSERYTKTDMRYVTKGGFWISFNKAITALIALGIMTAFANWLPQEEFGIYQFVLSVVSIIAIVSLPGINAATIRSIAKGLEGSLITAFKTRVKWSWLGVMGLVGVAGWYFINGNNALGWSFVVGALFFSLRNSSNLFSDYWNGKKKFDIDAKYRITSSILSALILVITLYLTNNIILVILAFFGGQSLTDYFFYLLTKRQIENKEEDPEMVPYGKSLTIMSIAGRISNHIDKIILWKFLGPVQVAVYTFSLLPIQRLQGVVPIGALALPKLSEKKIDKERKKATLNKFWKLFLIMIPITILAIFVAPIGYKLIFPQYMDSVIYAQILSLIFLTLPFQLLGSALVAEMKKKELYKINFISPFIQTLLLFGLIPFYGVAGAVTAVMVGKLIQNGMVFYYFKKL